MPAKRIEVIHGVNAKVLDSNDRVNELLAQGWEVASCQVTPGFERWMLVMIRPASAPAATAVSDTTQDKPKAQGKKWPLSQNRPPKMGVGDPK